MCEKNETMKNDPDQKETDEIDATNNQPGIDEIDATDNQTEADEIDATDNQTEADEIEGTAAEQDGETTFLLAPKRLHPAGMLFSFFKVIKETVLGLGIGTIAIFKQSPTYGLLFVGAFALFLVVHSILSWFRYTYRVEDGELRIEQGVLIRKKRYISLNRIHKIDLTANVLHRIFKLVKVQVDTASSGGGAEVALSAIKTRDAHHLRTVLKRKKKEDSVQGEIAKEVEASHNPKRKILWKQLFLAGSTSGSAGFILLAILFLFSQAGEYIPDSVYSQTYEWVIQASIVFIIILAALILVLIYLAGITGTMIKYGNFTIEKREKELFIKRGLLETKELTIPFDRIQAIKIDQSMIRQPLKYVQITAIVAGGSFDRREAFPVLFPLIRKKEVKPFLETFIPGYEDILEEVEGLGKKGRKYYVISATLFFILALFPVVYFFPSFSWIPALLLFISFGYGLFVFKESGYQILGKKVIFQYRGFWNKTTLMTYKRRIQAVEKRRHKFQQWEELATIKISLIGSGGMGTHFRLKHVENQAANQIGDWYSYRKDRLKEQTDFM